MSRHASPSSPPADARAISGRPLTPASDATASARRTPPASAAGRRATLADWARVLRPKQWLKNCFVLAPLLFSGRGLHWTDDLRALAAFATFCLVASGVYLFNDVVDRASDMAHPVKRNRPIAAGIIPPTVAMLASAALLVGAVTAAWALGPAVGASVMAYLAINILYTYWLKRLVIVDVFAIASFFVIRLVTGSAAIGVTPSVWLLLCGGLLSLYLGFAKRRHELVLLGKTSADHRAVLSEYSTGFLDQISVVLLAVTIVSYIMYTLTSHTAAQVGSEILAYSTIFVLYGVFRYLYLVHRTDAGGDAAETLLTDRALVVDVVLWAMYCGYVVYR
jgi:4-hydroxybenzoate polyprenyltransferase